MGTWGVFVRKTAADTADGGTDMIITVAAWQCGQIKVFRYRCTYRSSHKFTGFGADGPCADIVRYREAGRFKAAFRIDPAHNLCPEGFMFGFG